MEIEFANEQLHADEPIAPQQAVGVIRMSLLADKGAATREPALIASRSSRRSILSVEPSRSPKTWANLSVRQCEDQQRFATAT
jgi:hypothetical protein